MGTAHPAQRQLEIRAPADDSSLEADDDPPFPALFDLEHLDDRSTPPLDLVHDILVDVYCVFRGLLEECSVRDASNVGDALGILDGSGWGEDTSRDKVASQLLRDSGGDGTG